MARVPDVDRPTVEQRGAGRELALRAALHPAHAAVGRSGVVRKVDAGATRVTLA